MYMDLHTLGLFGVTELGTVKFHFAPNRRHLKLKFICARFQYVFNI